VALSRPQRAALALVAVTGCGSGGGESGLLVTITGRVPGAAVLNVQLVDEGGPTGGVHTAGDREHPVDLPATISVRLTRLRNVGVVVWVTDAQDAVLARAMTDGCLSPRGAAGGSLPLVAVRDGWTPSLIERCRCDVDNPEAPICPAIDTGDGGAPPVDAPASEGGADGASEVGDGPAGDAVDGGAIDAPGEGARDGGADGGDARG
jgi:hypothetical protein